MTEYRYLPVKHAKYTQQSIGNINTSADVSEGIRPQDRDLPSSEPQPQTKDEKATDSRLPPDVDRNTLPITSKL